MFWINESLLTLPQVVNHKAGGSLTYLEEASYELSVVECDDPFSALVLSWNAETPPGTSLRFEARVRYVPVDEQLEASDWSGWRVMGVWGRAEGHLPRSVEEEEGADDPVSVAVDVLKLAAGYQATAFQTRVYLKRGDGAPVVHLLTASTRSVADAIAEEEDGPVGYGETWLDVPPRSQHFAPPELENEICSPTSLAMVMSYYGVDQTTEQVVAGVYDNGAEIYGNWPFNTAYAGAHGLRAVVRHFHSMRELEDELAAGKPVIISVAFEEGELPESPTRRTSGHLLVVTGMNAKGDFYVNDPDADPRKGQPIERIYSRGNLRRAWLPHGGVGYVVTGRQAA